MRICLLLLLGACGSTPQAASTPPSNQSAPTHAMEAARTPPPATATMPACGDPIDMKCLLGQMEVFSAQMCACTDKTCAEGVNAALTKWGTELAKKPELQNRKPDPDDAKRSAEIMTRYTECMTKMFTGTDVKPPPDPCGGGDPCGGDPCGG